ncbi:hypothetical protein PHMEG_00018265 [Phytophthora megakarya]|uniref:Integrase catalytic domain-containing protein n=1 Tax=Phytophthora megakarya TaxID=4795 RepID=A0A225VUS0_9STRA|nr:hypothetical protein PHMEG_00018265 [Phytophthora megakarya]
MPATWEKKKNHRKKLDRATNETYQAVYAELLFPSKGSGSRYESILVIMDGYSRFVTTHLLKSKASDIVNNHLKEYPGRLVYTVLAFMIKLVLTDEGGKFVNESMEA